MEKSVLPFLRLEFGMSNIVDMSGHTHFSVEDMLDTAKEKELEAAVIFGYKKDEDGNSVPYTLCSSGFTNNSLLYLVEAGIYELKDDMFRMD
jgi:hypothetical protein